MSLGKDKKKRKKEGKKDLFLELQKENMHLKDKLVRNLAEFENFRKRINLERESWIKHSTQRLILKICDVYDSLERAIETGVEKHKFESFLKGIELIHSQFKTVLDSEGVEKVSPINQEFDPNYHEALSTIHSNKKEGTVIGVIQNGYLLKDKLIRPARVSVSKGKKEKKEEKK